MGGGGGGRGAEARWYQHCRVMQFTPHKLKNSRSIELVESRRHRKLIRYTARALTLRSSFLNNGITPLCRRGESSLRRHHVGRLLYRTGNTTHTPHLTDYSNLWCVPSVHYYFSQNNPYDNNIYDKNNHFWFQKIEFRIRDLDYLQIIFVVAIKSFVYLFCLPNTMFFVNKVIKNIAHMCYRYAP